jgi:hypothetical protein
VPAINFRAHEVRANGQGGREDFEQMIAQLVRAVRPGVKAMVVAANPGDWGIDVFVGDLGGVVTVWQSKYFMPVVSGDGHQAQIRESFKSAVENAAAQGFRLEQWILCVPSSLDGPTAKWWAGWKKRSEKAHNLVIDLWDETELRGLLMSPDAEAVRRQYYEPARVHEPAGDASGAAAVVDLGEEDAIRLESALFVRQLQEAGHVEVTASKRQFFNADLMAREIMDKGVPTEVNALSGADAAVHGLWEEHFNDACLEHETPALPGLHRAVMTQLRQQHDVLSTGLPGGPVHTAGLMHRVVDDRRAGWVRHWRKVAEEHVRPESASSTNGDPAGAESAEGESS